MPRNAVKPPDLSEIRGGVRSMGTLRYVPVESNLDSYQNNCLSTKKTILNGLEIHHYPPQNVIPVCSAVDPQPLMRIQIRLITLSRIRIMIFICCGYADPAPDPSSQIKAQTLEKVIK